MKTVVLFFVAFWCVAVNAQTLQDRYEVPAGFQRIATDKWGQYLRMFPVYPASHICVDYQGRRLYDTPQGAVLRIDLIGQDLQQCADACMRLRCEFLHQNNLDNRMIFHNTQGSVIPHQTNFRRYLAHLFGYANSYSLEKYDTKPTTLENLKVGDLLCHGGFPGHVAIIMDIAKDGKGNYALLCAQSWMPAQQIEVIHGSSNCAWHIVNKDTDWIIVGIGFTLNDLRTWK